MLRPREDEQKWEFMARFMRDTKMVEKYNTLEERKVKAMAAWGKHKKEQGDV